MYRVNYTTRGGFGYSDDFLDDEHDKALLRYNQLVDERHMNRISLDHITTVQDCTIPNFKVGTSVKFHNCTKVGEIVANLSDGNYEVKETSTGELYQLNYITDTLCLGCSTHAHCRFK